MKFFKSCEEGVHDFQPRYDEKPNELLAGASIERFYGNARELMTIKTYVKDVCVKCGKEIKK